MLRVLLLISYFSQASATMGAKISVPGIASPVRVDVAACVWIAYIFAFMFLLQLLLCAALTMRMKCTKAATSDVQTQNLEMKSAAMA